LLPAQSQLFPTLGKFCRLYEENLVAKRRNLKKEKAERNRAYARQFRSATTRTTNKRFSGGQRRPQNGSNGGGTGAAET